MDKRLLTLALGTFAVGTDSFVIAGVLPSIAQSFHVNIGAAGQLTTVYALAYALLSPTVAAAAANIDRKRLMLSGLGIFIVANLATAWAQTYAFALVARALAGLGAAMYVPTATASGASVMPPERRGFALSVVIAGLTVSTALGAPIGTVIGGLGNWRWTMVFVSAISMVSAVGITAFLSRIPMPPAVTLKQRLAPFADHRVGLTLLATLFVQCGNFVVYTYLSVMFDRATGGSPLLLGLLLVLFGTAGTISNLTGGRLIDKVGSRKVVTFVLVALMVVTASMSWTGATLATAVVAITLFGAFSWGQLPAQQHSLVTIAPTVAPIVLGLNTSATYVGVASAGVIGAAGLHLVGAHNLGFISFFMMAAALVASQLAHLAIVRHKAKREMTVVVTA
jgi:predicted MFS family arabinose efflux permease